MPTPPRAHTEAAFEEHIVSSLVSTGWREGSPTTFDPVLGLDPHDLFRFIADTQPRALDKLTASSGGNFAAFQSHFLQLLAKDLDDRGTLDVLRHGVKDRGVQIDLAYFRPATTMTAEATARYQANRLTVTRQIHFSTTTPLESVDLTLLVNGIPVATAELKNPLTNQNVENAKNQYRLRDPRELLFARRALVHFAVDPDLVFLTTKLDKAATRFLPFNQGTEGPGVSGGAGNPPSADGTYATSYLWREIWAKDTWLDLFRRFLHLVEKDKDGKTIPLRKRPLIFPRYHQWHAVRELTADTARQGSGGNYLVMHSAGSGKSNTIAWLAHRLSNLHGSAEPGDLDAEAVAAGRVAADQPVFHKIVVVTDRTVLDDQLGKTVYQFDHVAGVVRPITGRTNSKSDEVAAALGDSAVKIITATAQTFPYVLQGVTSLAGKRVAIVIDEAHSGHSGDTLTKLRNVLRGMGADDTPEEADPLTSSALARGRHPNLSFFAFTATPKAKTLQLFGLQDESGQYRAFHTYSMRQAIEEGFILDVLRNYVTYQTYWRVAAEGAEDVEVDPKKATKEIARFVYQHPRTLRQHAEIIIDHYRRSVARRLGGRAKAMVVTSSRAAAVDTYQVLREVARDLGVDVGILVAFSGTLELDGVETTEAKLNGFPESQLPDKFAYTHADAAATAGRTEYRILVVAEKYQTGFDQPLLTTMYVDKPLSNVAAVQTLSRLNRTHPRKSQEDLFVLDFANDVEDIQAEFRKYHETAIAPDIDPNAPYALQRDVMNHQLFGEAELQSFADAYMSQRPDDDTASREETRRWARRTHPALFALTEPAKRRFVDLSEVDPEAAEAFRKDLDGFCKTYGFISQITDYADPDLERLYLYAKHLLPRLPRRSSPAADFGEVTLTHLSTRHTGKHDVHLDAEGEQLIPGTGAGGVAGGAEPEELSLAEIIERMNERFGFNLSDVDRVQMEARFQTVKEDPELIQAALVARSPAEFAIPSEEAIDRHFMAHKTKAVELTRRFATDKDMHDRIVTEWNTLLYNSIRREHGRDVAA
ncbi:type I restriction endonuclease [Phytomonospora sp. NPDC050363]|uniref:type I restriction endonuclease subunit R n=1 Tax=Phytomonospora sp. NPDC050363 TaxID=3155642 RepID=UPI0033F68A82